MHAIEQYNHIENYTALNSFRDLLLLFFRNYLLLLNSQGILQYFYLLIRIKSKRVLMK